MGNYNSALHIERQSMGYLDAWRAMPQPQSKRTEREWQETISWSYSRSDLVGEVWLRSFAAVTAIFFKPISKKLAF